MSAGSRTPRERAEACFALARSATIAGERDAAVSRGIVICGRHGLDLDTFEIPGRRRARPETSFRASATSFRAAREPGSFLRDAFADWERSVEAARERTGAAEDEAPEEAARRNFQAACADARQRDQAREGDARA